MINVKNKFIGTILVGIMSITSISGVIVTTQDTKVVYAAESKALRDAKAKISHLTKSLKTNYLGIKNQGTWQLYIDQARDLIKKIPYSEKSQRDTLTVEVNKDEALVNGLARINQVEKSIQPKEEGGYGNYLGIKNAETWNEYLRLAVIDLDKVDKSIFKKQYDELIIRMNKVSIVVRDIEDKFQIEYDKVAKLAEEAFNSNDKDKAKSALVEAEKLGTCDRSDLLEKQLKDFISGTYKLITLPTGTYTVGKDIPAGRYVCTPTPQSKFGNFFVTGGEDYVNEILSQDLSVGVPSVVCDLTSGQKIDIKSLKGVNFSPVIRKLSNELTTGKWIVGLDIAPGKYVVTPKSGSGNFFVFRNGLSTVNEILGNNDFGVPSVTVDLQKNDVIKLSSIKSAKFTKVN